MFKYVLTMNSNMVFVNFIKFSWVDFMAISLKLICLFYDYPYFICIMAILGLYLKNRVNFSFLSNSFLNSHIFLIKNPTKLNQPHPQLEGE